MENIMGIMTGMLAILLIFGGGPITVILVYYFSRRAKNKERMAMIEKGVDPSIFVQENSNLSQKVLLWGMLLCGIGLGLLLGYVIATWTGIQLAPIMPILALLFGGFGLIGYYILKEKNKIK